MSSNTSIEIKLAGNCKKKDEVNRHVSGSSVCYSHRLVPHHFFFVLRGTDPEALLR